MRCLTLFAALALALVAPGMAAPTKKKPAAKSTPRPVDPFIKNTVWEGKVAAVDATSISVTSEKALTRKFAIHRGTIFGSGGSGALAQFQPGDSVIVNFSEVQGSTVARAENVSPPKTPRAGKRKKKKE